MGRRPNLILHTDTKHNLKKVREIAQALVLNPTGYVQGAVICVPPFYTLKSQFDLSAEAAEASGMANTNVDVPTELKSLVTRATLSCSPVKVKQFGSKKASAASVSYVPYSSSRYLGYGGPRDPEAGNAEQQQNDFNNSFGFDNQAEEDPPVDGLDFVDEYGNPGEILQEQEMNELIQQEYNIAAQEQEQGNPGDGHLGIHDAVSLQQLAGLADNGPHHPEGHAEPPQFSSLPIRDPSQGSHGLSNRSQTSPANRGERVHQYSIEGYNPERPQRRNRIPKRKRS